MWLNGLVLRMRSVGSTPPRPTIARALDSTPSWVCTQIFGRSDVVPEVGASSSGECGCRSRRTGGAPAHSCLRSISEPGARRTWRNEGHAARSLRVRPSMSTPWRLPPSGDSTATTGPAARTSPSSSRTPLLPCRGRKTAPAIATARCTTRKSQEFGSWTATTSPDVTPSPRSPLATALPSSHRSDQVRSPEPAA